MPATHSQRRVAPAASGAGYWRNGGASLRSATEGAKGRHDGGSPGTVTTSLKLASSPIESHARGACAAACGRRGGDLEGKFQNLERKNPSIVHSARLGDTVYGITVREAGRRAQALPSDGASFPHRLPAPRGSTQRPGSVQSRRGVHRESSTLPWAFRTCRSFVQRASAIRRRAVQPRSGAPSF